MAIEQIEIKNFRVLRDVKFDKIPPLAVVMGANGSGKSTLFDVFSFLKDALSENVSMAVAGQGGFPELVSRGERGPVAITVKFRESGGRLATYILKVAYRRGRAVVAKEVLRYPRGQGGRRPWNFVDFSDGKGQAITDESVQDEDKAKREEYELDDPSILAIKGLGQFREFPVVSEFRSLIENWHISNFHIAEARYSHKVGYAEHLSTDGGNVAQVAQYLYQNHPDRFKRILDAMRWRVPGISEVEAKSMEDGRLVLRLKDGSFEEPFIARYVSDGTIKMFAYLVLLHDPKPHPLLAVEEPENQLYPSLLGELIEEFRAYGRSGGQVFVSTHSPDFIHGAKPEEIYWFQKVDGFAQVRHARADKLLKALIEKEGESPGQLWRQGMFEGADPPGIPA